MEYQPMKIHKIRNVKANIKNENILQVILYVNKLSYYIKIVEISIKELCQINRRLDQTVGQFFNIWYAIE
jgi:hypothetical protein